MSDSVTSPGHSLITVGDVMTDQFIMVDGLQTVAAAVAELKQRQAQCILVNKRDDHDEFGIVLLSDVAKRVIAANRAPQRVNVYEVMSKPVMALPPDMQIRYAVRLFDSFGLSLAPVIARTSTAGDAAPILGVVTYNDIVLNGLITA